MEPQKEPNPNYLPYPPQSQSIGDDIDLRELFKAIWKGKWIILATTFVFAIGSVVYALSLPNIYKADVLLAPTESSNGGGLSQMASQLGGLAALAGVNFGGEESSQTELAVQVMKSRQFVNDFIEKHDLLVPLIAAKNWDLSQNKLIIDSEIYNDKVNKWLRKPVGLRGSTPTPQEAYDVFRNKILNISQDKESGLYILSVSHYSPYIAQQWAEWLVDDINQVMRKRAIDDATQNLNYLHSQLNKTSIADMQSAFYNLVEEQTKSLMLAEVQDEFVFKTIDPAVVPEVKSAPNRAFLCILATLIGSVIGCSIVMVIFAFKRSNNKAP
ncbi:Wzz/FepE/Etk N-terminal domain-containing protein [Vibrio harveyi]|uniref:Wzz/FepE/Etk N-terminal domain-containing protein n=1 Tax=Vibrio harveyi TaxID=669 RepID=UPI001262BC19|nr:Wzz/FepE/Etk N-terminal domain-containing protein [Vibrio harveyi]QFQ78777.1 LPS O-antigen length regulator [Vibrio harveyi]